jgi:hypothetical protein
LRHADDAIPRERIDLSVRGNHETLPAPAWPELEPEQGLILYRWELDDDTVWGHSGGETGAAAELLIRESDGAAVVVMMNTEDTEDTLTDVERAILAGIDEL